MRDHSRPLIVDHIREIHEDLIAIEDRILVQRSIIGNTIVSLSLQDHQIDMTGMKGQRGLPMINVQVMTNNARLDVRMKVTKRAKLMISLNEREATEVITTIVSVLETSIETTNQVLTVVHTNDLATRVDKRYQEGRILMHQYQVASLKASMKVRNMIKHHRDSTHRRSQTILIITTPSKARIKIMIVSESVSVIVVVGETATTTTVDVIRETGGTRETIEVGSEKEEGVTIEMNEIAFQARLTQLKRISAISNVKTEMMN